MVKTKIKQVAWGIIGVATLILGFIFFGKLKKLKQFEREAKVKKADADLTIQVDKKLKAKKKAEESYADYISKLTAYRAARAERDSSDE